MAEEAVQAFNHALAVLRELDSALQHVGPADIGEVVRTIQACCNTIEEVRRRVAVVATDAGVWAAEGYRTAAAWIARCSNIPKYTARQVCQQAEDLAAMPEARTAALEGRLDQTRIRRLTACRRTAPSDYTLDVDASFVELAPDLASFMRATWRWLEAARPAPEAAPAASSRMSVVPAPDGGRLAELRLQADDAAIVDAALGQHIGRLLKARRDGDLSLQELDLDAIRAQALVDLCDGDLRRGSGNRRAPDRHRIALTMQVDDHGNIVPVGHMPAASTCDAELFRLVIGAKGEVLDIGRTSRTWTQPQAAAIIRRDRCCRFPRCDAPPAQCDIHHCQPWENGGPTAITNGALLCRWHHTFVHQHGWRVELDAHQQAHIYKPDGTEHVLDQPATRCATKAA